MKQLLCALAWILVIACLPTPAAAQTPCSSNCVLAVGESFSAVADHDGANTVGYRLYIDNVKVGTDVPLASLQAGSVTVAALVAPARGSHTLQISAYNADFESKSDPFAFTTKLPPPGKPGNLRLLFAVVVADDGSVSFKFVGFDGVPPMPIVIGGGTP